MRRRDEVGGYNERLKMIATSINAIGLGIIGLGTVRPFLDPDIGVGIAAVASLAVALVLHGVALYIVSKVETDK